MAQFHFVEDYDSHVAHLIATNPLDEAMSLAVGGNYEVVGGIERDMLVWAGLQSGMSLLDFGCGSGQLAHAVSKSLEIEYLGIDIVQPLLDYAATKCPPGYRFVINHAMKLPAADASFDFATAFSVFTHLLPSETYLYLEDIRRLLKPGGKLMFSFLEVIDPTHWQAFMGEVAARRTSASVPLNMMLERAMIARMCEALDFTLDRFVAGTDAPWGTSPIGQSTVVLKRP